MVARNARDVAAHSHALEVGSRSHANAVANRSTRAQLIACALLTAMSVSGCGEPAARISFAVVNDGPCGRPSGATELLVTAFAGSGEVVRSVALDEAVELADFPADTEQLAVEIIVGGGEVGAVGKSAPIVFDTLGDGATIPLFMAPVDRACPTGAMTVARYAPLVAVAGDGVLVVGGLGLDGTPLPTAERYDFATGTFTRVEVPAVLGEHGFVGAALTALPDGRVVVSGGATPTITIYDPATHSFGESVLIEGRAFHAAIAIDDRRVLLAGGCSELDAGACAGVVRRSSKIYDVDAPSTFDVGPTLAIGRLGGRLLDIGVQASGAREYVLAGGEAPAGASDPRAGDRFALDRDAGAVGNIHARAARLDGGGVLSAFEREPLSGAASILAPSADAAIDSAAATAPTRADIGVELVETEDGRVLAFGAPDGAPLRYDPMLERWEQLAAMPIAVVAPSLVRLDDGSVLVLGGLANDAPVTDVLRFRPSLVGPATGALTIVPSGDARQHVLTPVDPSTVQRVPAWTLVTGALAEARAIAGGPRMATGSIRAVVRVRSGGVALVAQQRGPGEALIAELVPGEQGRVVRLAAGRQEVVCRGPEVEPFASEAGTTVELALGDGVRVTRDGATLAACGLADRERGAWGIAALGPGGELVVEAVTVAR